MATQARKPSTSPVIAWKHSTLRKRLPWTKKTKDQWFTCAIFSKDGRTLFTGGTDNYVRLWDLETGLPEPARSRATTMRSARALAFTQQGDKLASASSDYTTRLWNFDIVSQSREYPGHTDCVWTAAFSPEGQRVVTASGDGTAKIWDVLFRQTVAHPGAQVRGHLGRHQS